MTTVLAGPVVVSILRLSEVPVRRSPLVLFARASLDREVVRICIPIFEI